MHNYCTLNLKVTEIPINGHRGKSMFLLIVSYKIKQCTNFETNVCSSFKGLQVRPKKKRFREKKIAYNSKIQSKLSTIRTIIVFLRFKLWTISNLGLSKKQIVTQYWQKVFTTLYNAGVHILQAENADVKVSICC